MPLIFTDFQYCTWFLLENLWISEVPAEWGRPFSQRSTVSFSADPGGGGPCTCYMASSKLGKFEYGQRKGWVTSLASSNKCRKFIFDRHMKCQKNSHMTLIFANQAIRFSSYLNAELLVNWQKMLNALIKFWNENMLLRNHTNCNFNLFVITNCNFKRRLIKCGLMHIDTSNLNSGNLSVIRTSGILLKSTPHHYSI